MNEQRHDDRREEDKMLAEKVEIQTQLFQHHLELWEEHLDRDEEFKGQILDALMGPDTGRRRADGTPIRVGGLLDKVANGQTKVKFTRAQIAAFWTVGIPAGASLIVSLVNFLDRIAGS